MSDPFDLERFVRAQAPVYAQAVAELEAGRKHSHWMWFVFPQVAGLGFSAMSRRYAISSRAEAAAYLAHALLGPRLRECTRLVLAAEGKTAHDVFGAPDDIKFRSSMTLFREVSDDPLFERALDRLFGGQGDARTLEILAAS